MSRSLDIATPLGPDAFLLVGFSGQEGLSQVSRFALSLKSKRPDIKPEQMLGQNVTVKVELATGKMRYFNGYLSHWQSPSEVRDAKEGPNETKAYVYEAEMVPWLWFLTRQSNSRIFQNKTVPQIVEEVFKAHGGLASFKNKTTASYPKWENCVQYRETDFNFVSRLMEQEGIYYFVEHDNGKHHVTLIDNASTHQPFPGYEEVKFDQEDWEGQDVLSAWSGAHSVQTGRYTVNDYNPLTPKTSLEAFAEKPAQHPYGDMEFFDWPAEHDTPADAEFYAKVRIDEIHSRTLQFSGNGHVRGFAPGCVFKLSRHPVAAYNDKHLVLSASYQASGNADVSGGSGFDFSCSITAMPLKQQFRPARVTPKPLAQGPQTATVVGPKGEEIYTDEHGRIKVQFRWDRYGKADENSSCWMRVTQTWAGNGYGALALPRVGQEVVVQFLEGDPDWPIVVGSVYNGDNKPPYKLPEEKTRWGLKSRSSKGGGASNFNELRFEDKKGSEEIYLHAEKSLTAYTKATRTEFVGGESHLKVKKDALSQWEADVHDQIKGDEIRKVDAGYHLTAGQDWQLKVTGKMAVDASNEVHLKAGQTVVIEAGTSLTIKVGGSFVRLEPSGVTISGPMVKINSGGSAGSGSGSSPKTPKDAAAAHSSQGGKDAPMTQKAAALKAARDSATPFCEICQG
ncbi:MAG: type VI secretion system tip protein VgrG [Burkholderiaceae bacterium]|nr:MAG: type VI secretion system tip protein VgrG [Burkholderiaceae bacterium]